MGLRVERRPREGGGEMRCFRAFFLLWLTMAAAQMGRAADSSTPADAAFGHPSSTLEMDNSVCLSCHSEVAEAVQKHVHGSVGCRSCHVKHEEYPHPEGVPKPVCSTCHSSMAKDYARSVHAQAIRKGNGAAPDCTTCHGKAHEIERARTPQFRAQVPELCGACHSDVAAEYQESVHGQAVRKGFTQAAVCVDCHGEHSILPPQDVASTVHPDHVRDTCGSCHSDVRLTRRFGLPSDRIISFDASYHGLASKAGAQTVANCASCHGVHNIRASSDPKSTINSRNLAKTCGQCHVGAGQRFALGPIHTVAGETESPAVRWVRWAYLFIIPVTIGLMFLHNLGDWLHKLVRLRFSPPRRQPSRSSEPAVRIFLFERIQHGTLVVSFLVLAWSGFALKYPDQWWARPLLLWESARSTRGIIHRGASVLFIAAALSHVLSLTFSGRLRRHWLELRPRLADLREAVANFAYNIGLKRHFPGRSPHSYIEKAEYWALVWGTVIMVVTGLLLWFNGLAMKWLPKVVLDLATSIHFYEAILASLAIVVWHFYFVIFDPDVYPMDSAWLTGRSPRQEPQAGPGGDD